MKQSIIIYIINFFLGLALTFLWGKVKLIFTKQKAIENALKALLRQKIIDMYNTYMVIGYMPITERDSLFDLVANYKVLGGNGVVDDLVNKLKQLPTDDKKEDFQ